MARTRDGKGIAPAERCGATGCKRTAVYADAIGAEMVPLCAEHTRSDVAPAPAVPAEGR